MVPYASVVISSVAALVTTLLYRAIRWLLATRRPSNFPPGPPTRLGFGNFHQIPASHNFIEVHEWAKKYGPMTGLKLGTQNVLLLNDAQLVREFLVKRSAVIQGRPEAYMTHQRLLPGLARFYSLFMHGHESNMLRKLGKEYLFGSGLHKLAPLQKASGTQLVYHLFDSGDDWMEHILTWSLTTPIAFVTGTSPQGLGEGWMKKYPDAQRLFLQLLDPEQSPRMDIFPILRWVPSLFAEWKRKGNLTRQILLETWQPLVEAGRKFHGKSLTSFAFKVVRQVSDRTLNLSEDELTVLVGGLFDATWESTIMNFVNMIHALASHPEAQRKAQAEIDLVFGGRDEASPLPEKIDFEKLPYLTACVYETMRWRPIGSYVFGPLALPRETATDMTVSGYNIPKGTAIIINQWSIAHDEEFYDDPSCFIPERWLRDPVGAKKGVSQPHRKKVYSFGMGSRECLGKDYFLQNVKTAMAQILWTFNIKSLEQLDINPTTGCMPSIALHAKPFKVKWEPRRESVHEMLLREKTKADVKLSEYIC